MRMRSDVLVVNKRNALLVVALHGAAPGIEDEFFISGFDQGARPEAAQERRWCSGPEQSYTEQVSRRFCHKSLAKIIFHTKNDDAGANLSTRRLSENLFPRLLKGFRYKAREVR